MLEALGCRCFVIAAAIVALQACTTVAEDAAITIDTIESNHHIAGKVTGLRPTGSYKVVVYVHTDKWYIHPYAGAAEGSSWAAIDEKDGSWRIPTVKRGHPGDKIAALVVERSLEPPTPSESLSSIRSRVLVERTLTGTADEGKL